MIVNPLAAEISQGESTKPQKSTNATNHDSFFLRTSLPAYHSQHATNGMQDHFRWYAFEQMHLLKCRLEVKSFHFSLVIKFLFKINLLKILRKLLNKFAQVALGYGKIVNINRQVTQIWESALRVQTNWTNRMKTLHSPVLEKALVHILIID